MSDARRPAGEILRFGSQHDFEIWLEGNYERTAGVWLEIAKKG